MAELLVEQATSSDPVIATADPASMPEVAGPQVEYLPEAAERLVAARGLKLRIQAVSAPDDADLYEGGGLLPSVHARLAGPTFAEWLATSADRSRSVSRRTFRGAK